LQRFFKVLGYGRIELAHFLALPDYSLRQFRLPNINYVGFSLDLCKFTLQNLIAGRVLNNLSGKSFNFLVDKLLHLCPEEGRGFVLDKLTAREGDDLCFITNALGGHCVCHVVIYNVFCAQKIILDSLLKFHYILDVHIVLEVVFTVLLISLPRVLEYFFDLTSNVWDALVHILSDLEGARADDVNEAAWLALTNKVAASNPDLGLEFVD
jgi:hypothetical protein